MHLAPLLRAVRVVLPLAVVGALVAGLAPAATISLDSVNLAASITGDCDGDGLADLKEPVWAQRDDDDDTVCNGVDACPIEAGTCDMRAITVPADPANASIAHPTYSGATHTLKGIARYGGNQYMWDFGDGSAPTAWTAISDPYNLGVNHVYTGTVGQRFVATLSVRNSAAPAVVATDTYAVEIGAAASGVPADNAATDVRVAMAVDQARWYLHTTMGRSSYADGAPGYAQRYGTWSGFGFNYNVQCASADALLVGGSLPSGDYANDPYVETVRRSLNYILTNSTQVAISNQVHGGASDNPDTNGNHLGLRLGPTTEIRIAASCLTALARTASPSWVATTGTANVYGRTYAELTQDAVDWFAWGQTDSGTYRGSWGYTPNDGATPEVNSAGIIPSALAAAPTMGATVPAFVRTELPFWLNYDRHSALDNRNGGFGYGSPNDVYVNVPNTAGNLLGHSFVGTSSTSLVFSSAVGYLYRYWSLANYDGGGAWNVHLGNSSAMYMVARAMRAAAPAIPKIREFNYNTSQLTGNQFDWFYTPAGQVQIGLARNLVTRQAPNGSWADTIGNDASAGALGTALGILVLDDTSPFGGIALTATATHGVDGSNGWNLGEVVNEVVTTTGAVTAVSCSDGATAFSGAGSGSTWTVPITGQGVHDLTCTATGPGGSTTAPVDTVRIDSAAPAVTGALSPAAPDGDAGWYRTRPTVTWSATDATSQVAAGSVSAPALVGEGTGQVLAGSARDNAGNLGTGSVGPLKVDLTAPLTSLSAPVEWQTVLPVRIGIESVDNGSGVDHIDVGLDGVPATVVDGELVVTSEGRHTITYAAVDRAGNVEETSTATVLVDIGAPTLATSLSPAAVHGWHADDVVVTVTCDDGTLADGTPGSGVARCTAGTTVTLNGTTAAWTRTGEGRFDVPVSGTDTAGNTRSSGVAVPIDRTAPSVAATADRGPETGGWYRDPVTVNFACTDPALADESAGSGVDACSPAVRLRTDGTDLSATGTGTDLAGNHGEATLDGIRIDRTAPTVTYTVNGAASPSPWYTGDVTVAFGCHDATSGVVSCPDAVVFDADGANQSVTVTVADEAGNVTTLTVTGINIDRTAPTVTAQVSPDANTAGWRRGTVTIHWVCADPLPGSGVIDCPADQVVTADGADQAFAAQVADAAGNASHEVTVTIDRDSVAPSIEFTGNAGTYGINETVNIGCAATDGLSGIDASATTCTEVHAPAYTLAATNTLSATATDNAGNTATVTTTFTVAVTTASLQALVGQFVTNSGVAGSLQTELTSIGQAPNATAKSGKLKAFGNHLAAQTGKSVTAAQAAILLRLAGSL